ncbi:MAG TPA: MipA/OmpV family protein [Caldimonas sp.]|nr:MipA/OmpV family protein [Caldimonas sp.]
MTSKALVLAASVWVVSAAASAQEPSAAAPAAQASAPAAVSGAEPAASASAPANAASAPASAASAASPEPLPFKDWKWEGAIGPVVNLAPDYSGANTRKVGVTPGFYIRYGRLTASNVGGFVTRRNTDDIFQGLGLDLKRSDTVRYNATLRIDNGRKSSDTRGLEGIDDVRRTLRARFSATWQVEPAWKVASGLNVDLLGHGGGNVLDLGATHDRRWSEATTWSLGAVVTAGDARYMRSWFGVSENSSAATGKPVYQPGAGLRDVSFSSGWRTEIGQDWIVLWGGSIGRLLGPAAASPLTASASEWRVYAAVAWRF